MSSANNISIFINTIRDLCKVGICYYDLSSFFNYNKLGVKNNRGHYCAFCEKTRSLPNGRRLCEESDKARAVQLARQYGEPFFFECHMGMRELVIPLLREGRLLGILFVGQCRIKGSGNSDAVVKNALSLGGDAAQMRKLYEQLPLIDQKDLLAIGKLLSQYFESNILNTELLTPQITESDTVRDAAASMRDYIQANFCCQITPRKVAETFFLNPSYASRCFSKKYGTTLGAYICKLRLDKAKVLLRSTSAPISSIALNVSFTDSNYFTRVFKKQLGLTPQQYRNNFRKATD